MELSVTEKERYARQIVLNGFGLEGQLRLKESTVYVIGAGGLGSSLLLYLAAAGIGKLVIIDGDKVQLNNLQRQIIFNNQQLQKNKAAAAKDILQHLNEHTQVEVIETFINSENIRKVVPEGSLIADCSDNFKTRFLINDYAVEHDCVHVSAAVYKHQIQFGVFNYPLKNNERSATLRCAFPESTMEEIQDSCAQTGVIGVVPGIGGMLIAAELIKVINHQADVQYNKLITFDTNKMSMQHWQIQRKSNKQK